VIVLLVLFLGLGNTLPAQSGSENPLYSHPNPEETLEVRVYPARVEVWDTANTETRRLLRDIPLPAGLAGFTAQDHAVWAIPEKADYLYLTLTDKQWLFNRTNGGGAWTAWEDAPTTVTAACFSPNADLLAVGHSDGAVDVCEIPSGKQCSHFTRHQAEINILRFTLDGERVGSADLDGFVKVWFARTGKPHFDLPQSIAPIIRMRVGKGSMIVTPAKHGDKWGDSTWDLKYGRPQKRRLHKGVRLVRFQHVQATIRHSLPSHSTNRIRCFPNEV
jgi:WD40 repeat protein